MFTVIPLLLLVLSITASANAHSFLLSPRGDFKSFTKGECRLGGPPHEPNDNCPGPCISQESWQYDKNHSTTVFMRGQRVVIRWARNNHRGGFVRLSLVPTKLRMSFAAHRELAFRETCFETGLYNCTGECGTDRTRRAYSTRVQIPTSYPDGDYVLGWVWYGGTVSKMSYFGDYYSCAAVEIRGGRMQSSFQPKFSPGFTPEKRNGTCFSSVDRVGKCSREPCDGIYAKDTVPRVYKNGRRPMPIESYWFIGRPTPSATPSMDASESSTIDSTQSEGSAASIFPSPEPVAVMPEITPDPSLEASLN